MTTNRTRLYGGFAVAVLLAGAGGFGLAQLGRDKPAAPVAEKAEKPEAEAHRDAVALEPAAIQSAGIGVQQISAGGLSSEVLAQASVVAAPNGQAVLTARAAGRVTRVLKRLGDPVRPGEALAIVESREAAQMAADRSVANAKATLAQRNLAREKSLYDQRVSPRMDYEQAQAEAAAAAAEVRRAQASGAVAGITSDGRGVVVSSPIAGRVTAVTASLGAFVQPESELFRVADPRLVQVEATIGASDAARVAPGDRAELTTAEGRRIEGRVRSITPALNPETRSATAIIDMATTGLQPGQVAQARIFPRAATGGSAIVVPEEAVQTVEGREVVFVRTAKGFAAKPVRTGQRSAGRVEVLAGLQPGQVIATRNAFLLKAELGKGEGEEE